MRKEATMAEKRSAPSRLTIALNDAEGEKEGTPRLAVYLVDRQGKLVHRAEVASNGDVALADADLARSSEVIIGPTAKDHLDAHPDSLLRFHPDEIRERIKARDTLDLGKDQWSRFHLVRACVDGSLSACRYRPYLYDEMVLEASPLRLASAASILDAGVASARELSRVSARLAVSELQPRFPFPVCSDVCHGLVEVYRRVCCCQPIVVRDPRLSDLIRKLKEIVKVRPPIKWPPPPPPPPFLEDGPEPFAHADFDRLPEGALAGGVLNEAMINAESDLHALQTLDPVAVPAYLAERDYLRPYWCSCGSPTRMGEGTMRPDGTFRICWYEPLIFYRPGCFEEFAFVVRQNVNGVTVVIYDGLAAGQWFRSRTGIRLQTFDRRAIRCTQPPTPDDGTAFVQLEKIGSANSYRLNTPNQDSWDGVQMPDYNSGLLDPAPSLAAARGTSLNANWGGTLALTYKFSAAMQSRGATYYRVSVIAANGSGDPIGPRTYLNGGVAWYWYDYSGAPVIGIQSESLGPVPAVNGQSNLYKIPYYADHDWQWSAHAYLNSAAFAEGRYLVMLEVFNAAGQVLRPSGSSGPGTDTNFTFRRWFQEIGPTANVPFAALTHMFWWDNRPAEAHILHLLQGTDASDEECQFLLGSPTTQFSVGYRAYHPNPMFIYNHNMTWQRGLGGGSGTLVSSPDNAGQFAEAFTPTGTSATSFGTLLGGNTRCSFTVDLNVSVKTTNGSGPLIYLNDHDQASFALEV
jgi:hypothetical protein